MENDAEHTAPSVRASEPAGRPRGRRRKADSGDTRSSIIAAAAVEFAHHGYDSTSMRAIARRAGVDPALVHHYFGDKADLFAFDYEDFTLEGYDPHPAIKAPIAV